MGLGWVVVNNEALEFSASAVLWPFSTKAKILACLTALLVAPLNAKVTLYTDSVAIIIRFDNINTFRNLSVQKKEKISNFQIWLSIAYIIECKNLTLNMVKIKAHSGDRLNDRADNLAKVAASSAPHLNVKYLSIPDHNLEIACDNLTLEASSRKSIKTLFEARQFSNLLQLQRNSDLQLLTEHHHINWSAISFMLNYNFSDNDKSSTSFKQHRLRSFKYKIFSQELPTLSRMKLRRPDLYPSETCLSCFRTNETQVHFWTCPFHQDKWRDILDRAADMLMLTLQ